MAMGWGAPVAVPEKKAIAIDKSVGWVGAWRVEVAPSVHGAGGL